MDKLEFIIRQLAKTNKKNYENYVVTRIWNRLNDLNIKFITQQYISRPDGYALTDMYFPQIGFHIEVDEPHHKKQIIDDKIREKDIITATNHEIERIDISKGIEDIHLQIENIIITIKEKIKQLGDEFVPWDLEKEYNPETYIKKGYIHLKDNVAFVKSVDACNCFGCNYKGFQRGGTKHPIEKNTDIWFPKLYPNGKWDNQISSDGKVITEKNIHPEKVAEHIKKHINSEIHTRIVFARVKGPLGGKDVMYRFKGVFELDIEETQKSNYLVWNKISDKAKTYEPISKIK